MGQLRGPVRLSDRSRLRYRAEKPTGVRTCQRQPCSFRPGCLDRRARLTLNLGLRIEKESLPAPPGIGIAGISSINFSWSDKIEPRLGAAWGSRDGKMKIFGSYGVTNDVMKLLLAQTSWGAQGFETCTYPIGPDAGGSATPTSPWNTTRAAVRARPVLPTWEPSSKAALFQPALTDAATGVSADRKCQFSPGRANRAWREALSPTRVRRGRGLPDSTGIGPSKRAMIAAASTTRLRMLRWPTRKLSKSTPSSIPVRV